MRHKADQLTQKESFKLGEGLLKQVVKEAEQRERSKGYVIREALEDFFDKKARAKKRRASR